MMLMNSVKNATKTNPNRFNINAKDVVASFKDWFKSRNNALFDRIFTILSSQDHSPIHDSPSQRTTDLALSHLNLRLAESFVLQVLSYGSSSKDVLSCLRFFDWAGRQLGFHHTESPSMPSSRFFPKPNQYPQHFGHWFAMAGHPERALHLLGRMRFQGLDLDEFSYHVLLNALVEDSCFNVVDMIARQISMRGFQSAITHTIMVKSLCKQKKLDEANAYLRRFVEGRNRAVGYAFSFVVDALCRSKRLHDAATLLEEFRELNVPMEHAYGIWLRYLGQDGKLTRALEFLKSKKLLDGYVPDVFRYNFLHLRLLRRNRLNEVLDMLIEMGENGISPDKVTMNAILTFFCKSGMVDVAIQLCNSRSELGLSFSSMAYNYLINTLCGKGGVDEAYSVLRNSMDEGYFPGKKTSNILADALCTEGKLDKMKKLVVIPLERNFLPSNSVYTGYAKKPELARRIFGMMKRSGMEPTVTSDMHSYLKNNRISDALNFFNDVRRRRGTISRKLYNSMVVGLCRVKKEELALEVLREMKINNVEPTVQCYEYLIQLLNKGLYDTWIQLRDVQDETSDFALLGQLIGACSGCIHVSLDIESLEELIEECFPLDIYTYNLLLRWTYDIVVRGLLRSGRKEEAGRWLKQMFNKGFHPTTNATIRAIGLCSKNPSIATDDKSGIRACESRPSNNG
ncbi:hypothetical protein COLO4_04586 [Corchorus olitorius]|uniref:Pentacotripeptide-repeat region of PRORP domain-containing protein n=1 Tax=Corchorus olitorius TaxID=93759 RepID=A0A1R3KTF2_9ROSI|nr:hypothetical protein COLO4_04586 [Corchorus olitorius]